MDEPFDAAEGPRPRPARGQRCAICAGRLGGEGHVLREGADVPMPRTWAVCADCYTAVHAEIERAALGTPLRVRIAVGVLAAMRQRPARYSILDDRYWEHLTDDGLNRLLIWVFAVAFGVHAVAFALVAAYISIVH